MGFSEVPPAEPADPDTMQAGSPPAEPEQSRTFSPAEEPVAARELPSTGAAAEGPGAVLHRHHLLLAAAPGAVPGEENFGACRETAAALEQSSVEQQHPVPTEGSSPLGPPDGEEEEEEEEDEEEEEGDSEGSGPEGSCDEEEEGDGPSRAPSMQQCCTGGLEVLIAAGIDLGELPALGSPQEPPPAPPSPAPCTVGLPGIALLSELAELELRQRRCDLAMEGEQPCAPPPHCCAPPWCLPGILSMVHATQRSCSGGAAACVQGCAGQSACRAAEEGLCARSQCAFTAQGRVNAVLAVQGFVCLHRAALHARAVPAHSAALCSYCRAGPCACFRCRACVCIICIFAVQGFFACLHCLQLGALCVFESRLCCAGLRVPFARGELQQHGAQQQGPAHSPGPSLGLCSSAGSRQAPGFPPSSASPGNPRGPCREGPGISPAPLQRAGGRGAPHARCWLYLAIGLCVCVWGPWSPHGSPSHRWSSGWGASLRPSPPWPWLCTPMSSSLAVPMHPSLQRSGDTLRPLCHPRALWMCCGSVCMQHPVPHSPLCALHAPRSASLWECSLSPPMGAAPTCVIGATPVQRALRWDRGVLVHPC